MRSYFLALAPPKSLELKNIHIRGFFGVQIFDKKFTFQSSIKDLTSLMILSRLLVGKQFRCLDREISTDVDVGSFFVPAFLDSVPLQYLLYCILFLPFTRQPTVQHLNPKQRVTSGLSSNRRNTVYTANYDSMSLCSS